MGDTGVAVHPEDDRYRDLIGKHAWRPFPREAIPIIADEAIDREFGTGVLKVTPAHDELDWEIGRRHGLPPRDVMNPDGTINELGEPFAGMERFEARKAAAKKLAEMGLMVEAEDYENNVGFSERADVPIEPRLSEQWFIKYPKVDEAIRAVEEKIIHLYPDRWIKTYLHWFRNIQDWCISRQLWWGHRIPVWYKRGADRNDPANRHVSVDGPSDPENWEREEDVLDTWASSWLFPMATLGWPDPQAMRERGLAFFYPTSTLVTAFEIIFLWVGRMIVAGLEFMGEPKASLTDDEIRERIPFRNVYIHGLIRDDQGRKMSKSLGNSPDALELLERIGADGVRLGLVSIAPKGNDILYAEERLEPGRNFCNKLWNVCRFRQMSGETKDNHTPQAILSRIDPEQTDADDRAILGRLWDMYQAVEADYEHFELNRITQHLYAFFWTDFCDWYVEVSKTKLKDDRHRGTVLAVQDYVIRELLLILHPFVPFVTEELWHRMGYGEGESFLQDARMSLDGAFGNGGTLRYDPAAVEEIAQVRETVTAVRSMKADYNLAARRDMAVLYETDASRQGILERNRDKIMAMIGAESLDRVDTQPSGAPAKLTPLGTLYLDLAHSVNIGAERERLAKELVKLEKAVRAGEAKLKNEKFLSNAPAHIVEGARDQLEASHAKKDEIERLIASLS